MMILKVTKSKAFQTVPQTVYFLKYILRVKAWRIFFERNFNISFCQISNLSCYVNDNELRKKLLGKSLCKSYDD